MTGDGSLASAWGPLHNSFCVQGSAQVKLVEHNDDNGCGDPCRDSAYEGFPLS